MPFFASGENRTRCSKTKFPRLSFPVLSAFSELWFGLWKHGMQVSLGFGPESPQNHRRLWPFCTFPQHPPVACVLLRWRIQVLESVSLTQSVGAPLLQLCELKLGGKKPKTKNTQQVLALDPGLLLTLRQQEQLVPYGQSLIAS